MMGTEGNYFEQFIQTFKKRHGERFFLIGGCYIFAKILQVNFGGVIYSNGDHCKLKKNNQLYDIRGGKTYNPEHGYIPIDELEEARYKKYENFIN